MLTLAISSIAQADHIREHKEWREFFTLTFQMPQMWWAHCCKNSNGYFGCESTRNPDASFSGYSKLWFSIIATNKLIACRHVVKSTGQADVREFSERPKGLHLAQIQHFHPLVTCYEADCHTDFRSETCCERSLTSSRVVSRRPFSFD